MFCSHCGTRVSGNFCHSCGSMVASGRASEMRVHVVEASSAELARPESRLDWTEETDYRALLEHDEVRRRIAVAAGHCKTQISGEQILAVFDALSPIGVSMEKLCGALVPIYDKLGIRTGKTARQSFHLPPGRVLTAVLCSFAAHGITIQSVEQAAEGCVLTGVVPSNLWSLAGELVVSVQRAGAETVLDAAVKIPGQLYDWGKSRRLLDGLLQEATSFAA